MKTLHIVSDFIKDHFNRNNFRNIYFVHILLFVIGISFIIIANFCYIHKVESLQFSIIGFMGFVNNIKLDKKSRDNRFASFLNNKLGDFFQSLTVCFKKYFTPKRLKVINIVHEADFLKVNKTQLKYTAKYRNKKNDIDFNLFDIKIDLKNLNARQISCLFIGLASGYSNSPFKEEEWLFNEWNTIAHKSLELFEIPR